MTTNSLERFGDRLREVGYTLAGMVDRFGAGYYAQSVGPTPQFARAAAADDDSPLGIATSLFIHGAPVPQSAAAALAGDIAVDDLVAANVGEVRDGTFYPAYAIHPHDEQWYVASDFGESVTGAPLADDHVVGVGGASSTLAQVTPNVHVDSVWDLGTGCGVQALHATRYARTVVATDVSQRALDFARVSAQLSGVSFDVAQGSFGDPVAGRRFDRIVSNPPFVITARDANIPQFTYRDAGLAGDELLTHLLKTLPSHLHPGGSIHMLANWELEAGSTATEVLADRLDATGLDYWVIERETQTVEEYVALWLRDAGTHAQDDSVAMYRSWVADFEQRGVDRIGFGIIMMFDRRQLAGRSTATVRRIESAQGPLEGDVGSQLLRAYLEASSWEQFTAQEKLDAKLVHAAHVVEAQYRMPGDESPTRIELLSRGGLHRALTVDANLAGAVGAFGGELTVGQVATGLAALSGNDATDVAARLLAAVPTLLWSGVLTTGADVA